MQGIRVSRFGEPAVLELHEMPDLVPGPGQVLVRLHAAGVNPVETYIRSGKYARLPALPYVPGTDGAGTVEVSDNPDFSPGNRVYITGSLTGTYATHALCLPGQLWPLPERVTFEQGAALGIPHGVSAFALFIRAQAQPGETVLIHGASGGAGIAAVQLARAAGLRVLGTAGTPAGLDLVRASGAEAAFNHHDPGYLDQLRAATQPHGIDIIIEMLANKNLGHDLTLLSTGGRVAVIGSRGPVEIDARNLMVRNGAILGVILASAQPAEVYPRINHALEDGSLTPVIGHAFPLREAACAHKQVMSPGALGKVVLTM